MSKEVKSKMKLWLLRLAASDRWGYDEADGFAVRAESEERARQIAGAECGNEGPDVWIDALHSTCVELQAAGEEEVVMRDFVAG